MRARAGPSTSFEPVCVSFLLFFFFLVNVIFLIWRKKRNTMMDGKKKKQLSGAQKRKKKREKEEAVKEAVADMERLKLGPSKLWTGLVLHHKDVFVTHVLPKLNGTDRVFFSKVSSESRGVLAYAGVDVSKLVVNVYECTSISTLEWAWNNMPWGKKSQRESVIDQAWFCAGVAFTNKLELLKWAREVKHCKWDEETITVAARKANLEMLKYCFSNDCPYDEEAACKQAAAGWTPRLSSISFRPSGTFARDGKRSGTTGSSIWSLRHLEIFRRRKKDTRGGKEDLCVDNAARYGRLDSLKYLVEEAKVLLDSWVYVAYARYHEHTDCLNYLLEKGSPEPTEEQHARITAFWDIHKKQNPSSQHHNDA